MFVVTQFEPKVLSWWRNRRTKIDMEPPYQRHGRLWSKTDKAFLIDSILNEYDIPKFYIADFTIKNSPLNKKKLPYAIIDGKQRFEAIFDFYDGNITLDEDFIFAENPKLKLGGLSYSDLRKNYIEIAERYDNFQITVMRVVADREPPINELFVRLNRNKPLTGAEIRNAMVGPVPKMIRELVKHELFLSSIRFPKPRGQDKNAAAKILLFEYHKAPRETKRKNLDDFTKEIGSRKSPRLSLAGRHVIDTLDDMAEIFLPKDSVLSSAGILPVYYWLVRNTTAKQHSILREFLVEFERTRKANREKSGKGRGRGIDKELVEFDNYNRSTNDQASHKGRFEILLKRLEKFSKKKNRQK